MQFEVIYCSARCITIELKDEGIVQTEPYEISITPATKSAVLDKIAGNARRITSSRTVQSVYGLMPDTEYEICVSRNKAAEPVRAGEAQNAVTIRTLREFVTLNVRDFGAAGDGIRDDTAAIQTAILCCPKDSRVLIPEGIYRIGALFLKSGVRIELASGAELSAFTQRDKFPLLPGLIQSYDEQSEYNLASWEGNPLDSFASIITGIGVKDVELYGEGTINGNASYDNWWKDDGRLKIDGGFRPRTIFLNRCENITVQGIRIKNSPSWTIHPYFSNHTRWIDLDISNPKISPNTDGMDPESVDGLEVVGVRFSLGDDCIAVKSGKYYMGSTYKVPSQNIEIRQCCMQYGHGSVTLGSEIGAGVKNLWCHDCIFENTDRGLRVKTRRGRGKDSVIENIVFENIRMNGVLTPFVVNSFYWCCDPDGKSEYVRCKDPLPVDDRTPVIRSLHFRNIKAENCHAAAAFLYGLPEAPIEEIVFSDVSISFAEDPTPEYPAMMADVEPCTRMGIMIRNCSKLTLHNVTVEGAENDPFDLDGIGDTTV